MKKFISILLSILLITQVTVLAKDYSGYPQRFWDVPKDYWAFEYISELVDKNVLAGYEDGSYRPEETVTRAEWSKMMVVASGKQEVKLNNNGSYAVDYNSNDWYYGYINAVVDYMNFYNESDGTYFKPNQAVSREDVTVSLVKLKGYDTNNVDYSVVMKFKDNASISNSIKKYVAVGIEKGLISGYEDNTFRGQDTLTRAEAATLLCRAFQMGNDNKTNNNPDVVNPNENNNGSNNTSNSTQNDVNNNGNGNTNVSNNDENKTDKKEYKVETISEEINIENVKHVTFNNDDLYYVSDNSIYQINMISGKTKKVIDIDDIIINYEDSNYTCNKISNIYYDKSIDSLMVYGDFISANEFTGKDGIYARAVSIPDCKYIEINRSMSFRPYILGVTNSGTIIDGSVSDNAFQTFYSYIEKDDGIYMIDKDRLFKNDYVNINQINSFKNIKSSTLTKNYIYLITNNNIGKLDYNGYIIESINFSDINVVDKISFNANCFLETFYINSNDDIVFYDMTNKCFRMISKLQYNK